MARAHRLLAPPRNARLPAQHLWRTRLTLDDQDRAALVKALETSSTPWVTTTQLMVAGLVAEGCVRLIEAR